MGTPDRNANWLRRLDREETTWMVTVMGWTLEIFSNTGHTAMMRCQFREAIATINLQGAVREAAAQRNAETAPQAGVNLRADAVTEVPAVVGVDPRADAAVAGTEQVDVESQSSTEVVASDAEDEDMVLVELPESSLACPVA